MKSLFTILGVYISIIPLVIGFLNLKKLNKAFGILLLMISCETFVSIYSRWQQVHGINNLPLLHFLTFFEFLFGASFFYLILKNSLLKRTLLVFSILFLGYTSINSFFIQSIFEFNQIPRTLEGYLFVLFSFFYFYELLKQTEVIRLSQSANFWAVTAFFSYFGTTQFIHLFTNYVIDHYRDFYLILGKLNRIMVIVYYGIFAIAIWKKKLRTT